LAGAVEAGFVSDELEAEGEVELAGGEVLLVYVEFECGEIGLKDAVFDPGHEPVAEPETAVGGEDFNGPEVGGVAGRLRREADDGKADGQEVYLGQPGVKTGVKAERAEEIPAEAEGRVKALGLNGVDGVEVAGSKGPTVEVEGLGQAMLRSG
jgi:hypothetical protein